MHKKQPCHKSESIGNKTDRLGVDVPQTRYGPGRGRRFRFIWQIALLTI